MVLLADDDLDDLEIIQLALAENSYNGPVRTVLNGEVLLEELSRMNEANNRPSVILLDLNMPLMDGFEVLKTLKTDVFLKNIPVIIVSSTTRKEDENLCYKLGCNFFFNKPNSIREFQPLAQLIKKLATET